jgi:hypothetical protein
MEELRDSLGEITVHPLPIPHDCVDGFLGAYWRRPQMYLDERVRRAISIFSKVQDVGPGVARLQRDLANGTEVRQRIVPGRSIDESDVWVNPAHSGWLVHPSMSHNHFFTSYS